MPGGISLEDRVSLEDRIKRLQGPILILGASGFIGANLLRALLPYRNDVFGTASRVPAWRLEGIPPEHVKVVDLLIDLSLDSLLNSVQPRTILDCVAYGAYSFETDTDLIYRTNFNLVERLLSRLDKRNLSVYVHAGSSSEYGARASGPPEAVPLSPNSHYAVSKAAASQLINYYGKSLGLPCVNLRLYSVYGPLEDSSRLIPALVRSGLQGRYPEFVDPAISRDFIYTDDVVDAFLDVSLNLTPDDFGDSFNVGSGHKTTIADCAATAKELFGIVGEPAFTMKNREWDVPDWYANIERIEKRIGWRARTCFRDGLRHTAGMVSWPGGPAA